MESHTAFFYGTLMHPKILKRVIANDGSHLQLCPAVLLDFTRHNVKYVDYPGILPYSRGKRLFDRELGQDERSVRGTLVKGLTKVDMFALDIFEGGEYAREKISVHPLGPFIEVAATSVNKDSLIPAHARPLAALSELSAGVEAETYVYLDEENLEARLWSFDDFVRKNAWKWYADDNEDITEVDRRRAEGGR